MALYTLSLNLDKERKRLMLQNVKNIQNRQPVQMVQTVNGSAVTRSGLCSFADSNIQVWFLPEHIDFLFFNPIGAVWQEFFQVIMPEKVSKDDAHLGPC